MSPGGDFHHLNPNATVRDAATCMAETRASAVLVTENGLLQGIFTERDLLARVVNKDLDPETTHLAQVMTRDPDTVKVGTIPSQALARMHRGQYRHLPVVDEDGRAVQLLDILSMTYGSIVNNDDNSGSDGSTGWLRWRFRHAFSFFNTQSKQIKLQSDLQCALSDNVDTLCISQDSTVRQAVQHMSPKRLTAILSLDKDDVMNGIFTERDLVTRVVAKGLDPATTLLSAVMTRNPHCVSPQTPPVKALEMMHAKRFRHLPVVDDDYIVGILDILKLTYDSLGKAGEATDTLTSRIGSLLSSVTGPDFAVSDSEDSSFTSTRSSENSVNEDDDNAGEDEESVAEDHDEAQVVETIPDVYFKYKFDNKMYRVCITEKSLDGLLEKIKARIGVSSISVEYIDDDGDAISLCDIDALDDAIKLFTRLKWNVIRLNVHRNEDDVMMDSVDEGSNSATKSSGTVPGDGPGDDASSSAQRLELAGNALVQGNQYEEAIDSYSQALVVLKDSGDASAITARIRLLFRRASVRSIMGVQHGGLSDFRDIIALSQKYPNMVSSDKLDAAYGGICEVYTEMGQFEAAFDALKEIDSTRTRKESLSQLQEELQTLCQSGRDLIQVANYSAAAATYSKAIRVSTGLASIDSSFQLDYNLYVKRADAYIGIGDLDMAIADCNTIIDANPTFAQAYVTKGRAFMSTDNYTSAIKAFRVGLEQCPGHADLGVQLARAQHAQDKVTPPAEDKENSNQTDSATLSGKTAAGGDAAAIRNLGALLSSMNTK